MLSAILLTVKAYKTSSFFKAIKSGDVERVEKLMSEKPLLIHARTLFENATGLQLAARTGNNKMVALLIEAGADVNAKDSSGIAPLDEAAFNGNVIVADSLLNAGADVNTVGGRHNSTPLHIAAYRGHVGMVKLLLAHGANANLTDSLGETPLILAQENRKTNVIAVLTNPPPPK